MTPDDQPIEFWDEESAAANAWTRDRQWTERELFLADRARPMDPPADRGELLAIIAACVICAALVYWALRMTL